MGTIVELRGITDEIAREKNRAREFFMKKMLDDVDMTYDKFQASPLKFEISDYNAYSVIALKLHQNVLISYLTKEEITYEENQVRISIKAFKTSKDTRGDCYAEYKSTVHNATECRKCR